MLTCEIGILAKIKDNDAFLLMGNVTESQKKTQSNLYKIHSFLYFLHIFNITLKDKKCVCITQENEFIEIRNKFELSEAISVYSKNSILDGNYTIEWIRLYDITCMQPIFEEKIYDLTPLIIKKFNKKCSVILPPYNSAIKRGTLVESCAFLCSQYDISFLCINDEDDHGVLYKKYLLNRGVEDNDIDIIPQSSTVFNTIIETILLTNYMLDKDNPIYIAIDRENICGISAILRKFRNENGTRKLFYITNSSWTDFSSN